MNGYLILYEEPPDRRHIDVSIAPTVDLWLSRHQPKKALSILTPPLPLYLAFLLKSRLEKHLPLFPRNQGEKATLDKTAIMAFFRDAPAEWQNRIDTAWTEGSRPENFPLLDPRMERWIPEDAEKLIPFVEGRNGFIDQIERRLRMTDAEWRGMAEGGIGLGQYLPLLIQYLYFHGAVELAPGIAVNLDDGTIGLRCERCDGDRRHIHTYWCSLCETKDLVCDLCYPMGASKGCSCLVRRAKSAVADGADAGSLREEQESYLVWSGQL